MQVSDSGVYCLDISFSVGKRNVVDDRCEGTHADLAVNKTARDLPFTSLYIVHENLTSASPAYMPNMHVYHISSIHLTFIFRSYFANFTFRIISHNLGTDKSYHGIWQKYHV